MSRPISSSPPHLYDALKAEGFMLPDECGDVTMTMPVDGMFQLHYIVNLTADDIARIGRALVRLGTAQSSVVERYACAHCSDLACLVGIMQPVTHIVGEPCPRVPKCDGNHGGPRCTDPECWAADDEMCVVADQPMFYIENIRSGGDCCIWWRPDGQGYTRNLDEAWKVDAVRAREICCSRPEEDVARRASDIDARSVRHLGR